MVVRWVSTGIVEAEKTFRRVQGYRDIAQLVHVLSALEVTEEEARLGSASLKIEPGVAA